MRRIQKLVLSAFFLALGLVLPFLTGQIPEIGGMLSPMHIPVLLCGLVCGWPWGAAVGAVMPFLRHLTFGMPPVNTAITMTFELAAYGLLAGLLYKLLPKRPAGLYAALVIAMLGGRLVWGGASYLMYLAQGNTFGMQMFMAGAFLNAWPGIILHLAIIPPVVMALKKARLMPAAG